MAPGLKGRLEEGAPGSDGFAREILLNVMVPVPGGKATYKVFSSCATMLLKRIVVVCGAPEEGVSERHL